MTNAIKSTKYILEILKNNKELSQYISTDNIYPLDAKQTTNFPFAVIQRNSIQTASTKDGIYEDKVNFSIIVVDDNYIGSVDIAQAIRDALDYKEYITDNVSIDLITMQACNETYYNDSFIQELIFDAEFNVI